MVSDRSEVHASIPPIYVQPFFADSPGAQTGVNRECVINGFITLRIGTPWYQRVGAAVKSSAVTAGVLT
jgi:hypothetical protein